jgi:hypothetical protein
MSQKENKEQLLRLLSAIKGRPQTEEMITRRWKIDPDASLIHNTELSGKVASGNSISIKDYYPLVKYPLIKQPLGDKLEARRSKAEAR